MEWWHAVLLGIIEGLTEFLPISSTGHLTIVESLLGYQIDSPDITAFTAIIQVGAVVATLVYFRNDIYRVAKAWLEGLFNKTARKKFDYGYGWAIIFGSIPIGIVGLIFQDEITSVLRSLWVVAAALILWSFVMMFADKTAKQDRHEKDVTWKDTVIIGTAQCLALIPGISRSGATMSAGLIRGFDRVAVTRLSFFLSIPALMAAAIMQSITQYHHIDNGIGWGPTILATIVTFVVAYMAIAWLLRYISKNDYSIFIWYRLALGAVLVILLSTGVLSAT